jgi:hypothetical protein
VPTRAFYPVRKAFKEVFASMGPDASREQYIEALEQKLKDTCHQVRKNMVIPCRDGTRLRLDLLYAHQKVCISVKRLTRGIDDGERAKLQKKLDATGIPLGIILNFGTVEPEYVQVVNWERLLEKRQALMQHRYKPHSAEYI